MINPFCKNWHIHYTKKGRDYCNETGVCVNAWEKRFWTGKDLPWEKKYD